jgi:hypothetical protein
MYESQFAEFVNMTRTKYSELDDDNKWDYVKMLNEQ